jgi:hypothetical protein
VDRNRYAEPVFANGIDTKCKVVGFGKSRWRWLYIKSFLSNPYMEPGHFELYFDKATLRLIPESNKICTRKSFALMSLRLIFPLNRGITWTRKR